MNGKGTRYKIHTTYGRTSQLIDRIGPVGRFGEKPVCFLLERNYAGWKISSDFQLGWWEANLLILQLTALINLFINIFFCLLSDDFWVLCANLYNVHWKLPSYQCLLFSQGSFQICLGLRQTKYLWMLSETIYENS